jgi:hypothetical protein
MLRRSAVVAGAALLALLAAAPAVAHQGNPNYRSVINAVRPAEPGLKLQVLNFDDRLQLDNPTGKTVTVQGYQREPYLRVRADGTVEVDSSRACTSSSSAARSWAAQKPRLGLPPSRHPRPSIAFGPEVKPRAL